MVWIALNLRLIERFIVFNPWIAVSYNQWLLKHYMTLAEKNNVRLGLYTKLMLERVEGQKE